MGNQIESEARPAPVATLGLGRILHYRYSELDGCRDDKVGEYRPCIVVQRWSDTCANVQVFTDGANDFPAGCPDGGNTAIWKTSVTVGDGNGQMCWPPRSS